MQFLTSCSPSKTSFIYSVWNIALRTRVAITQVRQRPQRFLWTWWRHQMETFSALLALCAGIPLVTGGFPSQGPVTRSFGVFFHLRLNKRLGKHSRRQWFETPSRSLWGHCNKMPLPNSMYQQHPSSLETCFSEGYMSWVNVWWQC